MKIEWQYRYVPDGQIEPDKHGRWQVAAIVWVNTKKGYPGGAKFSSLYKKRGFIPITLALIEKGNLNNFISNIPSTKYLNSGFGNVGFSSRSLEFLMAQVEDELNKVQEFFKYIK